MKTVSVSELLLYHDCGRAWKYRYVDRLTKPSEGRNPAMASGTALHYIVENQCRIRPGELLKSTDARALATEILHDEFRNDDQVKEDAQVAKYLPGVLRAAGKIPEDVWRKDWRVEWDLELYIPGPGMKWDPTSLDVGGLQQDVKIIGRPDLWTPDAEGGVIEILDVKTTKNSPLMYMLWFPQVRIYAMMLQELYPGKVIQYRYLCVPTQGDKPAPQAPPWVFTPKAIRRTRAMVEQRLEQMSRMETEMREARRCDWCEFKDLCMTEIAGGDPQSMAKEEYVTRLSREEREQQL